VLAEAVGIPIRQDVSPLWGIIALLATSTIVSVGVSLLSRERFDFRRLVTAESELATSSPRSQHGPVPTAAPAVEAA
jgi:hypothetical protein